MGVFVEAFAAVRRRDHHRGGAGARWAWPSGRTSRAVALPRDRRRLAAAAWAPPTEADIDAIYDMFVPMNVAVAARYADVIPGAAETSASCARAG